MRTVLKHHSFMRLIFDRLLINTDDSITFITIMLIIYDIIRSSDMTVLLSSLIVILSCLQMFYGPVIDHFNVKKILINSQLVQAVLIGFIAVMLFFNYENAVIIIILVVSAALLGEVSYPI